MIKNSFQREAIFLGSGFYFINSNENNYQKQLQYNLCLLQCATKNSNSLLKVFGNTYEQEMDSIVFIICSHVFNGDKCAGRRTNTG